MRMSACLCLTIAALACLSLGNAELPKTVKVWDFNLPHGSLRVYLRSFPDGTSDLSMGPSGRVQAAPIAEQVEPLKQILVEMPKLGVDPRTLAYVGTRLFEEDVVKKLAYACADSEQWRLSMKNQGKGKNKLVVELLNRSGAYEAYNEAFRPYGLSLQVTEAEKIGLMRFSQVPPRDDTDRTKAKLWVPADAMLGMRFSQVPSNQ
jgi:hypothetical protein